MRRKLHIIFLACALLMQVTLKAQNYSSHFHDFGVMAGPVFFQSDYGERYDFNNYVKNIGYSIGGFYYLNADSDRHSFADYLKYRLEVSYMKNDLQHYGQWVDNDKTNLATRQLRAMRGSVDAINLGLQLEYFPWKNDDYSYKDWNPYISLGVQYSLVNTKAWSEMGNLGDVAVTHPKYLNAFRNDSMGVFSVTGSVGTRYRLDNNSSLVADLRLQYYGSDWVDGLNPDSRVYPENQTNDWLVWLNVGYIYSFD